MDEVITEPIVDEQPVDGIKEEVPQPSVPPVDKRKFKVKVDGQELEVDEEELVRDYQLSKASHKRFQEASDKLKQMEDLFKLGKSDPTQILSALGVDTVEFMESFINAQLEEQSMTAEQRELRDLRKLKAEQEEARKEQEQLKAEASRKQAQEKAAAEIDRDMAQAFKEAGVKLDPRLVSRVSEQLLADIEAGKPIDVRSALARTQMSIQTELTHFLAANPEEYLSKADKKIVDNLRKYFLKNVSDTSTSEAPVERQVSMNKKQKGTAFNDFFKGVSTL